MKPRLDIPKPVYKTYQNKSDIKQMLIPKYQQSADKKEKRIINTIQPLQVKMGMSSSDVKSTSNQIQPKK